MLQIKNISKQYKMGELIQTALDDVSLNLRDNEFVSILGKSGSGKSTLLNIIGGLDRYDRGDVIINDISTKNYKEKDWDSYRNHTIGFVFQSYNLIAHQTALSNVELALTISGVSKTERQARAKEVLEKVGLGDHLHKRPNQMSGGQIQRVAIARALINDPDILLADEPTGALDSTTSVQIMELMREVAKDKLVIMVTHNQELAENYSTRIVRLQDGKIIGDSDPFDPNIEILPDPTHKNMGKAKMSLLTSLSLSFNNLRTKKGRTLLTAFAGSIGIIGIALILALSSSVDDYITNIQQETMNSYPIVINSESFEISFDRPPMGNSESEEEANDADAVYLDSEMLSSSESAAANIMENNLAEFKKYIDDPKSSINQYIGKNGVKYGYEVPFEVYAHDPEGILINTSADPDELIDSSSGAKNNPMMGPMGANPFNSLSTSASNAINFSQITDGNEGELISELVSENYELISGDWPKKYDEVVLVLNQNNGLSPTVLYQLGLITPDEYVEMVDQISEGEEVAQRKWDYDEVLEHELKLLPNYARYVENDDDTFSRMDDSSQQMDEFLSDHGLNLKISAIVRPNEDSETATISTPVAYTSLLTDYMIEQAEKSEVIQAQKENKDINVLTGLKFEIADQQEKFEIASDIIKKMGVSDKANTYQLILYLQSQEQEDESEETQNPTMQPVVMDEIMMANAMDQWVEENPNNELLLDIYDLQVEESSYEKNIKEFGSIDIKKPSSISIYTDSFESKEGLNQSIDEYNASASEENQISYTDYVELITSSISTIIDTISYVLIAFVAVSLIVSSIMIGIITHISVLERTKEIGILRALGASKENISQVFNAETFIIGCFSGVLGIAIAYLLTFPINGVVQNIIGDDLHVMLPPIYSAVLIGLSIVITLIGGLIPARTAAKKDPVEALRTE